MRGEGRGGEEEGMESLAPLREVNTSRCACAVFALSVIQIPDVNKCVLGGRPCLAVCLFVCRHALPCACTCACVDAYMYVLMHICMKRRLVVLPVLPLFFPCLFLEADVPHHPLPSEVVPPAPLNRRCGHHSPITITPVSAIAAQNDRRHEHHHHPRLIIIPWLMITVITSA